MRRLAALLLSTLAAAAPAQAISIIGRIDRVPIETPFLQPAFKCVRWNRAPCGSADMANSSFRQLVILPSGFKDAEVADFWSSFDRSVELMTGPGAGSAWTVQKRSQLLFVGFWVPGGELGSATAAFGGKIAAHPIRGFATSLSQQAVYQKIDQLRARTPALRPMAVAVLFNTFQQPVTANAAPPGFLNRSYGIARYTRGDLPDRGAYVPSHELAHAGLNFLDEYVEPGFQDLSIRQIDLATPLILFDGSWGGFVKAISDLLSVYDYNVSEILSNNGNDNMTTSAWPTTVYTPGYPSQSFPYEGGMFFGRGTFHAAGSNLMNGNTVMRASDDGFAYAHSSSQLQVIDTAFGAPARRPNDRLRNAGPKNGWPLAFGSTTHVMLFDGDKNHHFHPTQGYTVQVGWYDRQWKTCWKWGVIPYPCYDDVWTTAQKPVYPEYRALNLKLTSAYGLAKLAQKLVCAVGINEISQGGGTVRLCDQDVDTMADNFLPTISFPVPYQDVTVPASQWFTTYWWRFSTANGAAQSGFTGWSSFYRSL